MVINSQRLVVGVDGSKAATRAVRWAAARAGRDGAPLRIVHMYEVPLGMPAGMTKPESYLGSIREQAVEWLEQARRVAAKAMPAESVDGLLAEAASDTVLVLGINGLDAYAGHVIGSTALAVAAKCDSPVIVVHDLPESESRARRGPVVVGIDGTPASEAALEFAFAESSARDVTLVAVHAWHESTVDVAMAGRGQLDPGLLVRRAEDTLVGRLAGWREKYPEVLVQPEVVHDQTARALRRFGRYAQLVVVGQRHKIRGRLLGSTAQHLLRHATCPVAVVRGGA